MWTPCRRSLVAAAWSLVTRVSGSRMKAFQSTLTACFESFFDDISVVDVLEKCLRGTRLNVLLTTLYLLLATRKHHNFWKKHHEFLKKGHALSWSFHRHPELHHIMTSIDLPTKSRCRFRTAALALDRLDTLQFSDHLFAGCLT